jgi:hypothetical protein
MEAASRGLAERFVRRALGNDRQKPSGCLISDSAQGLDQGERPPGGIGALLVEAGEPVVVGVGGKQLRQVLGRRGHGIVGHGSRTSGRASVEFRHLSLARVDLSPYRSRDGIELALRVSSDPAGVVAGAATDTDRYVRPDLIAGVSGDTVTLTVTKKQLPKED